MADTGYVTAGTGANVTGVGTVAWNDPTNIQVATDAACSFVSLSKNTVSNYLRATNFDFSAIPDGSTIDGIEAYARVGSNTSSPDLEHTVQLVVGGTITGSNLAAAERWNPSAAGGSGPHTWRTWGGASNLWGLTPTAAQVKASNFGVVIATQQGSFGTFSCSVWYVQIKVHYTEPEGNTGAFFALFNVKDRLREILKPRKRFWLPEPAFARAA